MATQNLISLGLDAETAEDHWNPGTLRMLQIYQPSTHSTSVFYRGSNVSAWLFYKVRHAFSHRYYGPVTPVPDLPEPIIERIPGTVSSERLAALLSDPRYGFVTQNGYFDTALILRDMGVLPKVTGDSFVSAQLIPSLPGGKNLQDLMVTFVDPTYDKFKWGAWETHDWNRSEPTDRQILYGAHDPMASYLVERQIRQDYSKYLAGLYGVELRLMETLARMKDIGVMVQEKAFSDAMLKFEAEAHSSQNALSVLRGSEVKVNSPKNLQVWLFEERGNIPVLLTGKKAPSTSKEALELLGDPVVEQIITCKEALSIAGSLRKLWESDVGTRGPGFRRYHPTFKPLSDSGGGRIYTEDPAVNSWNWTLRGCVIPAGGGYFYTADVSAFELMVAAYAADEQKLLIPYSEGKDIHRRAGADIFSCTEEEVDEDRREATKVVEFATIFGSEGAAVARKLKIPLEDAAALVARFMDKHSKIKALRDRIHAEVMRTGMVHTHLGRFRKIPEAFGGTSREQDSAKRKAFNTFCQSGAADIQKIVLNVLDAKLPPTARLVFTVFDSFLIQIQHPSQKEELDALLTEALTVPTPSGVWKFRFKSGVGYTWKEAKENMA